jgi:hypothetical protein
MFGHVCICIWILGLEGGYLESEGQAGEGWHVGKNDWVVDWSKFAKEWRPGQEQAKSDAVAWRLDREGEQNVG